MQRQAWGGNINTNKGVDNEYKKYNSYWFRWLGFSNSISFSRSLKNNNYQAIVINWAASKSDKWVNNYQGFVKIPPQEKLEPMTDDENVLCLMYEDLMISG